MKDLLKIAFELSTQVLQHSHKFLCHRSQIIQFLSNNPYLTKSDAEKQAKLEYLTPKERELWQKFKETKAQKEHWEFFAGSLKMPPATEPEAVRAYEEIADSVVPSPKGLLRPCSTVRKRGHWL